MYLCDTTAVSVVPVVQKFSRIYLLLHSSTSITYHTHAHVMEFATVRFVF